MAFSSIAKRMNEKLIISSMRDFSIATKQKLSRETGLSFPTASKIIDEFVETGVVNLFDEKEESQVGRKAYKYQLNKDFANTLCVYLHNQELIAITYNLQGEIIRRAKKEFQNFQIEIKNMIQIIQESINENKAIRSIVIGVPGCVNQGKIFMIDGYKQLQGCEVEKEINNIFSIPVKLFNNMSALAFGMARKEPEEENIVCIHFGKRGPGCGSVVNGKPVTGFYGFNGEVSFIPFDGNKTYRDVIDEEIKNNEEEYAAKVIISMITIINPTKLYLYYEQNYNHKRIIDYCNKYLPSEVMPHFIISEDYYEDYENGLLEEGKDLIYANLA